MPDGSHNPAPSALAEEIAYGDPLALFARFAYEPFALLFDAAGDVAGEPDDDCRYSYITVSPFATLVARNGRVGDSSAFGALRQSLAAHPQQAIPGLPPFQGGAAGYFAYDLCRSLEDVPAHRAPGDAIPDMCLGLYDTVIAFDHHKRAAWILSTGHPETDSSARQARARRRLDEMKERLSAPASFGAPARPRLEGVSATVTRADFQSAIRRVIDYIHAGDIFQANLTQRFEAALSEPCDAFDYYRLLRAESPAAFGGFQNFEGFALASVSPERFLRTTPEGKILTSPIKGTRGRAGDEKTDAALAAELQASEKDRAENIMIVDLLRNDLSRVAEDGSVRVTELCALKSFPTVHHLVSSIEALLQPGKTPVDLLEAAFPGGSITGAPKIRAMEIIAELERQARGAYCGAMGWIGFDGAMDTNIAIRTATITGRSISYHAGGGIVADSDPETEYEESLVKARAFFASLGGGPQ